jgi:hypothetical protein
VAKGKVRAELAEKDASGKILRQQTIWGSQLIFVSKTRELLCPTAGRAVLVDHRIPRSTKKNESGDELNPFTSGREGPAHTLFDWNKSMRISDTHKKIELEGGVVMVNQPIRLFPGNGPDMRWEAKGKPTKFRGEKLEVSYRKSGKEQKGSPLLSANVEKILAEDDVYVEDGDLQITAQQLVFLAAQDELIARGRGSKLARVVEENAARGKIQIYERELIRIKKLSASRPELIGSGRGGARMTGGGRLLIR